MFDAIRASLPQLFAAVRAGDEDAAVAWSQNERGVEHLRAIPAEPRPSCFRTPCIVNGREQLCGGVKVAAVGHSNDTKAWTAWDEYRSFYCDGLEEYQTLIFEIPQITERGTVGLWYNQQ